MGEEVTPITAVTDAAVGLATFGVLKGAGAVASPKLNSPDFIITPGGTAFPVPKGASGPTSVVNPAGKQTGVAFTGGSGGKNGQVSTMRIMDPNKSNPSGYIKYENNAQPKAQGVDPYSGRTVSPEKAHIPIDQ